MQGEKKNWTRDELIYQLYGMTPKNTKHFSIYISRIGKAIERFRKRNNQNYNLISRKEGRICFYNLEK